MMTLTVRLCALCAVSALLQMALPEKSLKGSLHMICGLLMIRLVVSQLQSIGGALAMQKDLAGIFDCLMR